MFCSECGKEIVNDAKVCSYCGQPVQINYQPFNSTPPCNHSVKVFKPDNQFNLVAGLFTWIWDLCKGMWDLFLADFLTCFICGLLAPFGIGIVLLGVYFVARIIIVGRNANYYYRLKELQKIPMYKAIQDANLRRI